MDNGASSYRRFLEGELSAFEEIIDEYREGLIFFINRYVSDLDLAEDIAAGKWAPAGEVETAYEIRTFIEHLTERNYQSRTVALMENGSWAPMAAKVIKEMFAKSKNLTFTDTTVRIMSALNDESEQQLEALACELCR